MRKSLRRYLRPRPNKPLPRLVVERSVLTFIEHEVLAADTVETGGILMGPSPPDPLTVLVTHASGSGPSAHRSACTFLRDTQYCAEVLREHFERYGVDYVGEWHSHVVDLARPSEGDLATLTGIMHDPDYDFTAFAMLLALTKPPQEHSQSVEIIGVVATQAVIAQVPVDVR